MNYLKNVKIPLEIPTNLNLSSLTSSSSTSATSPPPAPENVLGLRVLHEPKGGKNDSTVSIIFVHGLGGSSMGTWTHSGNIFWPTFLSEDDQFENAQISTFGYDSGYKNIFAASSQLDISDFASQLNDALDLLYDKYGDMPTLFVAHSMGGLIVKKALIDAYNNESFARIGKNVKGIVFMGTPHRGSDLAALLNKVLWISLSSKGFVKQLNVRSDLIQGINDHFRDRTKSLQLVSFYESRGVNPIGIIVPKDSATLGFPGERYSPLNGDHISIVKFTSKEDDNYIRVVGSIGKLAKTVVPIPVTTE